MDNQEIAKILDDVGDMLDIKGEMPFKIRAYHRAANSIRSLPEDINKISKEERLSQIPAVGKGIADRIQELLSTGKMGFYEALKEDIPSQILELMQIPGLGPRKAKQLYDELNITTIQELHAAVEAHRLVPLRGMNAKTESNILRGIEELRKFRERILLFEAYPISERILKRLRTHLAVKRADAAGSLRRMRDTIGDIDLLVASEDPTKVMDFFCHLPEVVRILAKGSTKSSVIVKTGLQVDIRVVTPEQYGSALQYFTGSKEHSVHLRDIAKKRGFKISEYGIFEVETGKRLGGATEEEIYQELGMDWIPPVLREDKGEIEAALEHRLPKLVERHDLRGDLHVHSRWSDGLNSIREMAEKAIELGYEYICFADHAEKLKVAGGLTPEEIEKRQKEIDGLNEEFKGRVTILAGAELNIDNDGTVDYPDALLERFDVVTASIHKGFNQSKEQLTERTIKAMENRHIDIIGHPTGRILGKRPPFALDVDLVLDAAAKTGTFVELNSFPDRLDLKDDYLREAKRRGVKIVISTDAHLANHLRYISYGVSEAQRGWLEPGDVANTLPLDELKNLLGRDF